MKHLALITLVVLTTIAGAFALWRMHEAVQLLVIALAIAAGMSPTIRTLMQRGLSRTSATAVVFVVTLGVVVLSVSLFGSLAYTQASILIERLPSAYEELRQTLLNGNRWASSLGSALPSITALTASVAGRQLDDLGSLVITILSQIVTVITLLIGVATLAFYWLLDQQRIERLWLSLLPLDIRTPARVIWEQLYTEVGIYVRGEALIVFLTATSLLSVYTLLGVPGSALLALIGGIAQIIPLLGFPIALLSGAIIAFTQGVEIGALTIAGIVFVMAIIKLIIAPKLFRSGINVNPVLVIVLIMVLAEIGGLWMILLAPPLAAAIQASLRILAGDTRTIVAEPAVLNVVRLQEQLDSIEAMIEPEHDGAPQLRDMLSRTRKLVTEAGSLAAEGNS